MDITEINSIEIGKLQEETVNNVLTYILDKILEFIGNLYNDKYDEPGNSDTIGLEKIVDKYSLIDEEIKILVDFKAEIEMNNFEYLIDLSSDN